MAIAHLSSAEYAAIAKAYSERLIATGKGSVEFGDWPSILGDKLFRTAFEGGYFGPKGTIPGFPPKGYEDLVVKGVQVAGTTDDQGIRYDLYVDGEIVATEHGSGDFDTVAFAKRHGQDI